MIHRFDLIEIDEPRREFRVGGRAIPLQPKVFELLACLARNRDRVVSKDELLETVWPGVIVTDASLQRAVSLARSALAAAGRADAIRTHARQGYRLCIESLSTTAAPTSAAPAPAALARAHTAYDRGDWEAAIQAFREVDDLEGLSAADLQRWAHAAQCAGRPRDAAGPLERAVAAYSSRGDRRRAAWAAILLAQLHVEWRESAPAQGWYHRAARLLAGEEPCRERGYLDLLGARMALLQNDLTTCIEFAERARAAGETFGDPDLESLGLVHLGEARLYLGQVREGLAALDEAGVSVVANGLSAWAGGLVYCGVIFSCMTRADWQRAGQWTDQFTRWCEGKGVAAYPGLCRLHRAEVLTVRGNLLEAEREARGTIEMLACQAPWAEGDAWVALGEILLARGAFADARRCFERATELGWESRYGLALVLAAEGDSAGAERLLARALQENVWSCSSRRGLALANYAIIASAAGKLAEAHEALAAIAREPDLASTPALQALVERAHGEIHAAEGNRSRALAHLRAALRAFVALEAPLAAAQVRCRMADLLRAEGEVEAADLERDAAVKVFQHAGADGLLQPCARPKPATTARPSAKSPRASRAVAPG